MLFSLTNFPATIKGAIHPTLGTTPFGLMINKNLLFKFCEFRKSLTLFGCLGAEFVDVILQSLCYLKPELWVPSTLCCCSCSTGMKFDVEWVTVTSLKSQSCARWKLLSKLINMRITSVHILLAV